MNKKMLRKMHACVATTVLVSPLALLPAPTQAIEKEPKVLTEQSDIYVKNTGLRGIYYHDAYFRKPVIIAPNKNGDLKLKKDTIGDLLSEEKQSFQSVRWVGYLTPSENGEYEFSTSSDEEVMLQIDEEIVIQQDSQKKKLKLEKGKSYEIVLEYVPKQGDECKEIDLKLYWSTPTVEKQVIPEKNIHSPELIPKEKEQKIFPKQSLFYNDIDEDLDTDNDSIPDIWEKEGYTVQGQMAVKWDERLAEKGYKKYRSNPYKKFTAGDPYTDFQKASNQMDDATNKVAKNPLVAAYPTIGVLLDNITISRNNDITSSWGGDTSTSFTKGTSNSKTNETSEGIDTTASMEITASITPSASIGVSVTNTFNKSNSTTATIEESSTDTSGRNWGESIGINTAQSAYLGPRVRYINTGTAPVYQLKPDVSIGMRENHTLTSGIVDEKYRANVLNPNEMFPKKESLPILVNKHEGTTISIDFNELLELEKKKTLRLDSTQFDGLVSPSADKENMKKWDGYINNIEHVTSRINFNLPNESTERRIAAPVEPTDPEDMFPKIDLGEAIEIGFGDFKKTDEGYRYKDYIFEALHMIYDKNTAEKFKEQAQQNENGKLDPLKMKLNAGMNIQIGLSGWVTNMKTGERHYIKNQKVMEKITSWSLNRKTETPWDFGTSPNEGFFYDKENNQVHVLLGSRGYIFKEISKPKEYINHPNGEQEVIFDVDTVIIFELQKDEEVNVVGTVNPQEAGEEIIEIIKSSEYFKDYIKRLILNYPNQIPWDPRNSKACIDKECSKADLEDMFAVILIEKLQELLKDR